MEENLSNKNEEQKLIEDTSGKVNLSEAEIIRQRKERIINLLKKDKYFSIFIILAVVSLLLSLLTVHVGLFSQYSMHNYNNNFDLSWLLLGFAFGIGAFFIYEKKDKFAFYPLIIWVAYLAVKIRTMNLDKLRDITTGTWTLGPDLDPFLFLRWAEYIVENGKLFAIDMMRFVPFGYNTKGELLLHPYMMAWFHKIAVYFGSESVTHSAVLYPVVMFALTVIAFFLFVRKIFIDSIGEKKASIIGIISAIFLSILPIFLPRTIAGIPEKESAAFLFMFLSFYFFLCAWKTKTMKLQLLMAFLAGLSTGAMALIWGGYSYLLLTISTAVFVTFICGSIDKRKFYVYLIWIISYSAVMLPASARYSLSSLVGRGTVITAFIISIHFIIFNTKLKNYFSSGRFSKIPPLVLSSIVGILILIVVATIVFGFDFIIGKFDGIFVSLIRPAKGRIVQTVAENKSPFFVEWVGSFGPYFKEIPLFFWLFFLGSIFLFYKIVKIFSLKERFYLTASYLLLLLAIVFNKYSPTSKLNGDSTTSILFYASGFLVFLIVAGRIYYNYYKKGEMDKLKNIDIGIIIVLLLFLLTLMSLRGGIRLVMVLVPTISIFTAYLMLASVNYAIKTKGDILRIIAWIFAGIVILAGVFSGWQFFKQINGEAGVYAPSIYTQQWQKAMAWVRENTPENSVFGHWWDYGYWLQSIGRRATMLDGGNAQGYWNHMMGRYALTGRDERKALEFLYAHNATHFLIDSTDIGKYSAFSTIGSDANYDRMSWMTTFMKDNSKIQETKNGTIFVYAGGTNLDEDISYEENETKIFLPSGNSGLGAVLIEQNSAGELINPPVGIYISRGQQYRLPMRYAYLNERFYDFEKGVTAGVFLMSRVDQNGEQFGIEKNGALLYLSNRTVESQLARLYLYKEDNPYFKLIHSEDDFFVSYIKTQNADIGDIVFYNGIRGPIRIWEIKYPNDIEFKEEYLSTVYPEELGG